MKLKILNKNRINDTGTYDLSNLMEFDIVEGFTITKNYNETLDSANIRIAHLSSEIDIEPFDEVILYGDNRFDMLYFCVNSYTCTQDGLDNGTYSYEISLFSQTKKLEGIIIPSLSITPLKTGQKRSLWYYMTQYNNEYGRKIRVGNDFVNEWAFDTSNNNEMQTRFNAITCPELQWNEPTLREVLTDLMMVDDCIPTLNNGVIGYIDLTKIGTPVSSYNYVTKSQTSDDYVSEIKMNLRNSLQTSVNNTKQTITTTEYLAFKSDANVLTSENVMLKTTFPILNIKHLWMIVPLNNTVDVANFINQTQLLKYDLCNLQNFGNPSITSNMVKEYKDYQTLDIVYRTPNISVYNQIVANQIDSYYSKKQNYCLYYNRNGREIRGFTNISKGFLWSSANTTNWLRILLACQYSYGSVLPALENAIININRGSTGDSYPVTFFQIEYETSANQTFSASKSDYPNNYRQIVDNQTNSWVDTYTQGFLEYQKANRLGNQGIMLNQRVLDNTYIKLAQTYDTDYVVYNVTYQIYEDHIETNANATKNYILRDYYTGVKSKIRTWVNATDEAFMKDMLVKYYCEFSYTKHDEYNYIDDTFYPQLNDDEGIAYYMLNPLTTSEGGKAVQYVDIRTYYNNTPIGVSGDDYFFIETKNTIIGNSIVLSCGFSDNALAGNYYELDSSKIGTNWVSQSTYDNTYWYSPALVVTDKSDYGGYPLNPIFYANESTNYEFDKIRIGYAYNMDLGKDATPNFVVSDVMEDIDPLARSIYRKPLAKRQTFTNYRLFTIELNTLKDNKEIPTISTQLEYCCDNRDVYFTREWINQNQMVRVGTRTGFKYYESDKFSYGSMEKPNDATEISSSNITITDDPDTYYSASIDVDTTQVSKDYIYIVGNDNKVWLCFKKASRLYLNFIKDRNKNIYNSSRTKIGEI